MSQADSKIPIYSNPKQQDRVDHAKAQWDDVMLEFDDAPLMRIIELQSLLCERLGVDSVSFRTYHTMRSAELQITARHRSNVGDDLIAQYSVQLSKLMRINFRDSALLERIVEILETGLEKKRQRRKALRDDQYRE